MSEIKDDKKEPVNIYTDIGDGETKDSNDLSKRINQLYGLEEKEEIKPKEYDPKELESVRKKLLFLLIGVVLTGIAIVLLLISPIQTKKASSPKNDENNVVEEKNDNDEIPLGDIDLSNNLVTSLNNLISFGISDFLEIDLFPLYTEDVLISNDIPNDIKLHLLKKSNDMYTFLNSIEIEEYIKTCNPEGLVIKKIDFDSIVSNVLSSRSTIEYKDFNYLYYSSTINGKKLTFNYLNDQYIVKCNEYNINTDLVKNIQQNLYKAVKTEDAIELYQYVVFINRTGVYKDPLFTTLITDDRNATFDNYIDKGNTYKYTFAEEGENYSLSKIELLKETSN